LYFDGTETPSSIRLTAKAGTEQVERDLAAPIFPRATVPLVGTCIGLGRRTLCGA
jgi:hypothetical protein